MRTEDSRRHATAAALGALALAIVVLAFGVPSLRPAAATPDGPLLAGWNEIVWRYPSRDVAEGLSALGAPVTTVFHWDAASQEWRSFRPAPFPPTANTLDSFIQDAVYWFVVAESTPLPEAIDVGLSPALPVPVGESLRTTDDWEVTFLSVDLDASAPVVAMDPANVEPPPGYVYFLARVRATWVGMGATERTMSNAFQGWARFQIVTDDGFRHTTYDPSCGTLALPLQDFSVQHGESLNGYLCWVVPSTLVDAVVLVDDTLVGDGDDLRWFATR